jgi:hypothetical protein
MFIKKHIIYNCTKKRAIRGQLNTLGGFTSTDRKIADVVLLRNE